LTDGALTAAPNFADVGPALYALLAGRRVVVYDVQYDTRLLAQSDNVFGIVSPPGISTVDPFVKTHTKQINVRVLS
jgi:hypothetical protein